MRPLALPEFKNFQRKATVVNPDPERVRAALLGQEDWGRFGSAAIHRRYMQESTTHVRCHCGNRKTHIGMALGDLDSSATDYFNLATMFEPEKDDDGLALG